MDHWWRIPGWPSAEEWEAFWTFIAAVIALFGLGFAGFQLRQSAIAARRAARAEEAQSRPYLNVRFGLEVLPAADPKKDHVDEGMIFVVIESIGRTPAMDIALRVNPAFRSSGRGRPSNDDETDPAMTALRWVFSGETTISMLGPGEQLQYVLDFAGEVLRDGSTLPTRYEVVAEFGGGDSGARYQNTYVLDLEPWRYSIARADALQVIARQLRRVNENLEKG